MRVTTYLRRIGYLFYRPAWLGNASQAKLADAVAKAEGGHRGEIKVVIERAAPVLSPLNCSRGRALGFFSTERVWDTEHNTGVLVYVCLSDHELHVLVDRGLNQVATTEHLQQLCDLALTEFSRGNHVQGLVQLITALGEDFKAYDCKHGLANTQGNELSNAPSVL